MRVVLALCAATVAGAVPGSAAADPSITETCNGAACSTGWYTDDVHVVFVLPDGSTNPQGCGNEDVTTDTTGVTYTCTVDLGTTCCIGRVTIMRDATPPTMRPISASRSPDSNGWYNHAVSFSVSGSDATSGLASCSPTTTYSGPDSGSASVTETCTDNAGNVASETLDFPYDSSPPTVTAQASRAPDANGWYNQPVDVSFSGSAISGISSCTAPTTYAGPDSGAASVSGSCTDKAGNTGSTSLTLKYDSTPPSVSAHADRSPDSNGWYDHPVGVTFTGGNDVAGIASCTSSTYSGPDSGSASVSGGCTDEAGNSASTSFGLRYDSTPPTLTALTAEPLDRGASLDWKASTDAVAVTVARAAGKEAPATVYSGKPRSSWRDAKLRNGVTYTYTVTAVDRAGYAVVRHVRVRPSSPLLAPAAAARVHGGTTLRWRPKRQAGYYNVQLWYRGAKVLSAWPTRPRFRVAGTWSYLGRPRHLEPGGYVWYVWPGYGPRSRARFGPMLGKSTFVVAR